MTDADNETWLLEAGHRVLEEDPTDERDSADIVKHLIWCLWVADYGMRNAGDLETARDLNASFKQQGYQSARTLNLPRTTEAFALSDEEFERDYFALFDAICAEIRPLSPY
ncbi:hypothetical protein [Sphingopyxis sp.]|uniref:hypothetical protein n=1 Tax=Sphingopyxis sp. TaxID=1908224 RepID=UPI0010F7229B|nr:hypothetical protein [Sphingopyxis sp.]MBR2172594.1 hypothetical protein [Sphingopyxis sp.]